MVSLKVGYVERFSKCFSKIFPCFLTFRCLLHILLHICRLYLNSLDEAAQLMIIKEGKALVPLFPPSCSSLGKGDGSLTPDKNLANFSPIPIFIICTWNFFASIGKTEFEMFSNCAGKHQKCDVQTSCDYIPSSKLTGWPIRACELSQLFYNHH